MDHADFGGAPTTPASKHGSEQGGYLREYVAWVRPFAWSLAGVFALAVAAALLALVFPLATRYAIDDILLTRRDADALTWFGVAMLALILVQQSFYVLRQWRIAVLNARMVVRLRRRLFRHLMHLPLRSLADMKTGHITSRLSNDLDQLAGLLQITVITPGVAIIKVLLTIVMLTIINWKMAAVASVLIPPLVIMNLIWVRRIRPIYKAIRHDRSDIDGRVTETFGGIRIVRGFARERTEERRYAVNHHAVIRKTLLARKFELIVGFGWGLLIPLISLLVIWYGGTRLLVGEVTIGGIMAFQMYILMLLQPVSIIVHSYGETQQVLAAMERVLDVLRRPVDKPDRPGAIPAPQPVGALSFEDVHFEYRSGVPVLNGISFEAAAGQTIAL
ncbi:MAG: ABC transporter transmembrane domain-containing protein, partial [Phycisphaerae bacterium]